MKTIPFLSPVLPLLLCVSSAASAVDDAAVHRCRAIADVPARVACYDAMPLGAASATTAAAPAASPEQRFGMRAVAQPKEAEPEAIRSTVAGHLDGWSFGTTIRLANGQVWRVEDYLDAMFDLDNPAVEIVRGALGAYYLQVAGRNDSARVVRLK
jgi:hypothetical protein